jgi:hypothetical protein
VKYKIHKAWIDEIELETNDKKEAINFIKIKEQKEYNEYSKYVQECKDNYEEYSDYYPNYYIEFNEKFYDITNLFELKQEVSNE